MSDTTNKPKQMVSYDTYDIGGLDGVPFDEDYCSGKTIGEIIDNVLQNLRYCDYCSTKLLRIEGQVHEVSNYRDYCFWYCRKCRFWQARFRPDPSCYDMPPPDFHAYISKLREFNGDLPEGCNEELASHIRQCPALLHSFNPTRFEKFVADVFRANYTNAEVLHVGKPHDGGVDVLLIDTGKEDWLIQVKRRKSQNRSEGVNTIRNVLGAMIENRTHNSIIISTAKQFSRYAIQTASAAKVKPYCMTIKLVDKGVFNKMLDPILPDRPWLDPISEIDEGIANYLAGRIPSDNQLDMFKPQTFQLI